MPTGTAPDRLTFCTLGPTATIVVSCKIKTAAHLRAVYGPEAAGNDLACSELTRRARARAVSNLEAAGIAAAAGRAAAFVVDDNEPYLTGQAYLKDFELSLEDANTIIMAARAHWFDGEDKK